MAKVLQKVFIPNTDQVSQSFTVQSWHVSQSVDAFTGASDYDITISGSLTVIGPVISSGGFTGSLLGTASWADNAISASFASTASFAQNAQTASYVLNAVSSSFSSTASYVNPLNQTVILTGSLNTTGSVTFRGLTTQSQPFLVTIDNLTGQLAYTSSAGFITGAINPGGTDTQIQYNNNGAFGGVPNLTWNPITLTLRATGSFTGSLKGNLQSLGQVDANFYTSSVGPNGITMVEAYANNYPWLYGNVLNFQSNTTGISANQLFLGWSGTSGAHADNYVRSRIDTGTTNDWSPWAKILTDANYTSASINRNGDNVTPATPIRFDNIGTTPIWSGSTTNLPLRLYSTTGPAGMTFNAVVNGNPYAINMGLDIDGSFRIGGYSEGGFSRLGLTSSGALETRAGITANGNIVAIGSDIIAFASSDKNLKDNITPISNPIEKIQKIGGYEFDWNNKQDTYEGHDVGVIAQEIEEVLPELVQTRDNGYKAVKYEKIVALLIEAIKEQQKQIEELKSKIK